MLGSVPSLRWSGRGWRRSSHASTASPGDSVVLRAVVQLSHYRVRRDPALAAFPGDGLPQPRNPRHDSRFRREQRPGSPSRRRAPARGRLLIALAEGIVSTLLAWVFSPWRPRAASPGRACEFWSLRRSLRRGGRLHRAQPKCRQLTGRALSRPHAARPLYARLQHDPRPACGSRDRSSRFSIPRSRGSSMTSRRSRRPGSGRPG